MGVTRAAVVTVTATVLAVVSPAAPAGAGTLAGRGAPASGGCAAPVPSPVRPDMLIADPACDAFTGAPFEPLTDAAGDPLSTVHSGIDGGAGWRIEVPRRWNGDLVLFEHGSHGPGLAYVEDPGLLRRTFVEEGFAWAASSYEAPKFGIGEAARNSHDLLATVRARTGRAPRSVYLYGISLGGQVVSVMLEQYPRAFAGALSACGVLDDVGMINYDVDTAVSAAALTGAPLTYPLHPPAGYPAEYAAMMRAVLPALGTDFAKGTWFPSPQATLPTLTPLGRDWGAVVEQRSGGTRPGFPEAFRYWSSVATDRFTDPAVSDLPVLLGLYPGLDGGTLEAADGNLADNRNTVYRLHTGPVTADERALNAAAVRTAATVTPWYRPHDGFMGNRGRPGVPVMAVAALDDLLVPLSTMQEYTRRVQRAHQRHLLVNRVIRTATHCDLTQAESDRAFGDLVRWVRGGHRPAGDDVLDPGTVADPAFGCQFTVGDHPGWTEPCPATRQPRRSS